MTLSPVSVRRSPKLNLDELNARFERWAARDIVAWAVGTFGSRVCVTSAMADTVMVHLATSVDADVEVVFLDTGFHFAETLATLRRAQVRYGLNLRVERPVGDEVDLFAAGTDACCAARKVAPLNRALADKDAWMTGLRRADGAGRANTPVLSIDARGLVKVCPIATWSDDDVDAYIRQHDLIVNPLLFDGYASIGCWPCTEPVAEGADARSGRWAQTGKTECGIHL